MGRMIHRSRVIALQDVSFFRNRALAAIAELADHLDRSLLIVEDDKPFLGRLGRAMESRGFAVTSCDTVAAGLAQGGKAPPAFAAGGLRPGDGDGLDSVPARQGTRPAP